MDNVKEKFIDELKNINRTGITNLIKWLEETDFFIAPASNKYHGNHKGGLVQHSYLVMKIFKKLNEIFNAKIPDESIVICGLLHDVCKTNFYTVETRNRKIDNKWESYNAYAIEDKEPLGHGSKSIIILSEFIKLTKYEIYAILWHMGLPVDYADRCSYNGAMQKHPSIVLLQSADHISSTMFEAVIK